jgi:hypothetical protein
MAKDARHIFARQRPLSCAVGKGNARHRPLSCAKCDARQRKGVDGRPQRDGITRSLSCATQILTAQKKKEKKQGRPGPASARPRPRRRRPPVLRSPRQRRHHHHTPAALLGPPPPHLSSSAGSLGRRASREGVVAPRPDLRPPPLRPGRGGKEPPRHGRSRGRRSRVEDGATPGEEGGAWGGGQPARGRIRCRTAPRHC